MTASAASPGLFAPIEPFERGMLEAGDGHCLYYEMSGNPAGRPVVVLHGGPGSCTSPPQRRFFDPAGWRIVLFDQRGCGQSSPLGSLHQNDTRNLVRDIERLRLHLDVDRWVLFGGSWGSTLGLAYALEHPDRVSAFVLRGVFLGSRAEVDWYLVGLRRFVPEAWQRFASPPSDDARELLSRYHALVGSGDQAAAVEAAQRWVDYERALMAVGEAPSEDVPSTDEALLARVRVQLHYLANDFFLAPGALLAGSPRLQELPAIIVQGRRDLVCPPQAAHALTQRWPAARLLVVEEGGHSALHPAMVATLVEATEALKETVKAPP